MPRAPLVALTAAAIVALAAGAALGGEDGPAPPRVAAPTPTTVATPTPTPDPDRIEAARLPLPRLAGAVVILRFTGSPVPEPVLRALKDGHAAGAILFGDNTISAANTRLTTRRLQRAAGGRALIATDQEGGAIRNLPWAPPATAPPALGTDRAAATAARAAARGLRRAGVNVNLAPVADLGSPGPLMRARAFPGGPAAVARLTAASVRVYRGTGVAPTAKHFPGLGAARANTDDAAVTIGRGARALGATDLPPFQAAIAAGVPMVMLSNARYPALDPQAIAAQSRPIVSDLLKLRLGFRGVAVTDSLEAEAVRAERGPGAAAVRSIRAGVDLVLTTGPASHRLVWRALLARARADARFRARLRDAAARVLALRRSLAAGPG